MSNKDIKKAAAAQDASPGYVRKYGGYGGYVGSAPKYGRRVPPVMNEGMFDKGIAGGGGGIPTIDPGGIIRKRPK